MDERGQQRKIRHHLAVVRHAQEVTGNVALTCRYYGMSRPTSYQLLDRYEEFGEERLRDGSSRPLTSSTQSEVGGKIICLRQNYHFGTAEDLDAPAALPRHHDQPAGCLEHPQAAQRQPLAQLAALQTPQGPVETL